MRHNKEKLIEISKPYFEQKEALNSVYVTEDGHVFYKEAKGYLEAHIQGTDIDYEEVLRSEALNEKQKEEKKEVKPEVKQVDKEYKELLLVEAKELGLSPDKRMGIPKLEQIIKEAKDGRE